jgi:peptidoglycan hydrolase CwlO-like protein
MSSQELMSFCEKFGVIAGFAFLLLLFVMSMVWKIIFDQGKNITGIEKDTSNINTRLTSLESEIKLVHNDLQEARKEIIQVSHIVRMKRRDLDDQIRKAKSQWVDETPGKEE